MENNKWHWQESGKAWKGMGIYHVTMVVPSRGPLLGKLVIPDNDPERAYVERKEMGDKLVDEVLGIHNYYPQTRILQYCGMPDHIHFILHVWQPLDKTFNSVIRGFWQGAKKIGRTYTIKPLFINPELNSGLTDKGW